VTSWLGHLAAIAALTVACGGAASRATSGADAERAGEGAERGGSAEGDGERQSGPPLPSCDDGTCFRCGAGICPQGFYCDEDAQGGAACAWLPSCADSASCACVKQALGAACKCQEQGGGVSVSCD
jgi:hypothetical protein